MSTQSIYPSDKSDKAMVVEFGDDARSLVEKNLLGFHDACVRAGVKFRMNVLSKKIEVEWGEEGRWRVIDDDIEAEVLKAISQSCYFQEAKQRASADFTGRTHLIKTGIRAQAISHPFDPIKDYLDGLPAWDGVKRLTTMWDDQGLIFDAGPFTDGAQAYLITEAIRFTLWPNSPRRVHIILCGPPNSGKSAACKMVMPKHLRNLGLVNDSFTFTTNKAHLAEQILGKVFVEAAEAMGVRKSDIRALNQFLTQTTYGGARMPYEKYPITGNRRDVVYFTTNEASLPPGNQALNTRIIQVKVSGRADRIGGKAFPAFDRSVWDEESNDPRDPSLLDMLWAEGLHILKEHAVKQGSPNIIDNPFFSYEMVMEKSSQWNEEAGAHFNTAQSDLMMDVKDALEEFKGEDGEYERWVTIAEMHDAIWKAHSRRELSDVGYDEMKKAREDYVRAYKSSTIKNAVASEGTYRCRQGKVNGKVKWGYFLQS